MSRGIPDEQHVYRTNSYERVVEIYRTSLTLFVFLFIAVVYFAQEYIPLDLRSRGRPICIHAQNKRVQ